MVRIIARQRRKIFGLERTIGPFQQCILGFHFGWFLALTVQLGMPQLESLMVCFHEAN